MLILATLFVKLFNSECYVSLSKHFFSAFSASEVESSRTDFEVLGLEASSPR